MYLENPFSHSTVPFIFTIFGLLLFLFVLSSISRKRNAAATKKAPPEASGAWPLIGHLHLLGGSKPPHVTLGDMADKYGPIFTLRLGTHKTLVVSNYEMAKQCFTVNDRAFASRPKSVAFEVLGYNFSMMGFSPYGSYWRHVRKITTLELLSTHRINLLKHVMESAVKEAMKDIWLKKKNSGSQKVETEMKRWFGDITLNIMFRAVVGKRFVSDDGEDGENERIRKVLRELFDLSGSFAISDALPYLRWLDLDGREKDMKRTAKELDGFAQVWLEEHKHNRNSGSGTHDFMDVLLNLVEKGEEFDGRDVDTTIKATCLAMILAGSDTTTGTLTWALSLLLNNREILNKVIDELETQIGKKKRIEISDLTKLEYLQCIIKETLRLYPPAPLNLPHETMEDCTVGGYHVPTGTRLLTNISKLQRDSSLYLDPLEFRPERFLTTHKDVDVKGQHFELIPFGAGRRMCPGLSFSLPVMQLSLATLLHGFDIVTPDEKPVDMREQIGLTNIKASPLHVILTPRLSHTYDEI
ncbi:cytochrome P450 CYP82D47 [Cajanus cajan]|uniref:cytochrome P450 CYP82D47 n=1 Tax=Cajanus cajan TaxID=3821 RepID=UPI00098DAC1C|nr:cytochrome P450 CYP82D47 [Cajanus cajan]